MVQSLQRMPFGFPGAEPYTRILDRRHPVVREESPRFGPAFSERHLQCVWADPSLRPGTLTTAQGESVVVEDPGVWNLEAGPDFLGAALRLEPMRRRITGDVEIHIRPADWKQHGHDRDPRYAGVKAHVTFYPGTLPVPGLPPGVIQIALRDALQADPLFSFESIDLAAYPYSERAVVPPCREALREWTPGERAALLSAAGQERLRRKSERLAATRLDKGTEQTLYEEVLSALGYKHNKIPFRQLARRLPVAELRAAAGGDPDRAFALLAGASGLFPRRLDGRWPAETRRYVRAIWDHWWKVEAGLGARVMNRAAWRLANLRPANHPLRRMMAAALLFARGSALLEALTAAASAEDPLAELAAVLGNLADDRNGFWGSHLSLAGARARTPVSLLGPERIQALVLNVALPWLALAGEGVARRLVADPDRWPAQESNTVVRQTAYNLFGPDHSPALYGDGLRSQGLTQIFHDFCLNDRFRCATCPFPGLLRAHRSDFMGLRRAGGATPGGRHQASHSTPAANPVFSRATTPSLSAGE